MLGEIDFQIPNIQDYQSVWEYATTPRVSKYLTWKAYTDQNKFDDFFYKNYIKKIEFPNIFRTISINSEFAGTLHMFENEPGVMQIGFGILPIFWGSGNGYKILNKICSFIIENFKDIAVIRADCHVNNSKIIHILEKKGFIKNKYLENSRISYEIKVDKLKFLNSLFSNSDIEGVFEVGNLNKSHFSDFDYVIAFYEEAKVNSFIKEIQTDFFSVIDNPAPYHYFFRGKFGEIFDVYLLASSSLHAIFNVNLIVFDKSNFLSQKFKSDKSVFYKYNYQEQYIYFLIKIFDKFMSGKLIQVERLFSNIRDSVIVPYAIELKEAVGSSTIDIHWKNKKNLYKAYMATYSRLEFVDIRENIKVLYEIGLSMKFVDNEFIKRLKELQNNVEWL
ncbi:TPA: GNAT family N-acetyltransferase [Streptococcus suis]